jgi:hypothetical protein
MLLLDFEWLPVDKMCSETLLRLLEYLLGLEWTEDESD